MDAFSHFERMIDAPVWKQQPAPTLNYLCITPNCHSACGVQHSVAGVFLLFSRQFSLCSKCNHPHLAHFHLRSTWEQVYEVRLSVDGKMRRRWEAAKNEKERTEALVATSKSAMEDLSRIIDEAIDELARLGEEYASLSLSGSFSAPLEKAIWLLEQRCKAMEERGVGLELLTRVRGSLDAMRLRLDLLRRAREKAQEGVRRVEGGVQRKDREVADKPRDRVRKVENVQETTRTVETETQGGLWYFWEPIKDKLKFIRFW